MLVFSIPMALFPALSSSLARLRILCGALAVVTASVAHAGTIRVPQDKTSIQSAIDAASNGDTVVVSPGTYVEKIDFRGKAITVVSASGPAQTVIDGGGNGSAVSFVSGESRASVIDGFTIENSKSLSASNPAAGISVFLSAPTIQNNVITRNGCNGVRALNGSPMLRNNVISETSVQDVCGDRAGSAVVVEFANPFGLVATLVGNTIENNNHGTTAAINIYWTDATLESNIIRNNASGVVGAISIEYQNSAIVAGNLIYGNSGYSAGALMVERSVPSSQSTTGLISNNTIVGNRATGPVPAGSQVRAGARELALVNNIIVGNDSGPAVSCGVQPMVTGVLTLITGLQFDHNLIYNSQGDRFGYGCLDETGTHGNIAVDPQFVNASGNDYHLAHGSPAIDTGNNSVEPALQHDLDGGERYQDATGTQQRIIDIGAYEASGALTQSPTTAILSVPSRFAPALSPIALKATLSSALGTPTGTVTFMVDGKSVGTATLVNGVATLNSPGLTPGVHDIVVTYPRQGAFAATQSVVQYVVVDNYQPTITITSSLNPAYPGDSVTFDIQITSPDGAILSPVLIFPVPPYLQTVALVPDSSGKVSFTTDKFKTGTTTFYAFYNGDDLHKRVETSVNQVVREDRLTSLALTSSPNPSLVGTPVVFHAVVTALSTTSGTPTGTVVFTEGGVVLATIPVSRAYYSTEASADFTTSSLPIGSHEIIATYSGDSHHFSSDGDVSQIVDLGYTASFRLLSSANPSSTYQNVVFSAFVDISQRAGATVPPLSGTVTFREGANVFATVPINNGSASFSTSSLGVGPHTITADFNLDAPFSKSARSLLQQVTGLATTTTAAANQTSFYPFSAVQVSAVVRDIANISTFPSGSVQFVEGAAVLATVPLDNNGQASYTLPTPVAIGSHTVTVRYVGDTVHAASSSAPMVLQSNGYPTTLTLAAPATAHAFETGTISMHLASPLAPVQPASGFLTVFSGPNLLGTGPVDASGNASIVFKQPAGDYPLTARFAATGLYLESSSAPSAVHVIADDTSTILVLPGGKFYQRQAIPFSIVTTAAHSTVVPSGVITLFEGTTAIASAPVDAAGHVTMSISTLSAGTHALNAVYTPEGASAVNFLPSTSLTLTLTVDASDFALTVAPSISVPAEHHTDVTANLRSIGIFSGRVQVSCANLPAHAVCYFNHGDAAALVANSQADVVFWFETSDVKGYKAELTRTSKLPLLACFFLPLIAITGRRKKWLRSIALAALLLSASIASTGCSGIYPGYTPPGTYTFQVVATDGTTTHSTDVTLNVSK